MSHTSRETECWWKAKNAPGLIADAPVVLKDDQRTQWERERDRILYADEFERLRGVTQVISPTEGILCHDRHSHSLRVEQLAVRMATNRGLIEKRPPGAPLHLPNKDVVAAAALAHDLGHPPFGHVAEDELNRLLREPPFLDEDGYEGNAQSFRILTRLACHRKGSDGLKLSRRTLRATLKYPWLSTAMPVQFAKKRKYGAYISDRLAFDFAMESSETVEASGRSIDAAIMDTADSITYAVHDLFDFYRAGLISLTSLGDLAKDEALVGKVLGVDNVEKAELQAIGGLSEQLGGCDPYTDARDARSRVQTLTSELITLFVSQQRLYYDSSEGWAVHGPPEIESCIDFLKGLTRSFVIDSDRLAVTQVGHRRVIRRLFKVYIVALCRNETRLFPAFFRSEASELSEKLRSNVGHGSSPDSWDSACAQLAKDDRRELVQSCARLAADVVASLTDRQALAVHARLTGIGPQDGFTSQREG